MVSLNSIDVILGCVFLNFIKVKEMAVTPCGVAAGFCYDDMKYITN